MGARILNNYLDILLELAQHGIDEEVRLSTPKLAEKIGLSQQSASRLLKEMEAKGVIARQVHSRGQVVLINKKGKELLAQRYQELSRIFGRKKMRFAGRLASGLGRGRYFISLKGYQKQFLEKLNFGPYPGTLNLKVDSQTGAAVRSLECLIIGGFSTRKKSYGGLRCARAKIVHKKDGKLVQIPAAVVMPFRTVHESDIVEVIAPFYLRGRLSIKDGDIVRVVV